MSSPAVPHPLMVGRIKLSRDNDLARSAALSPTGAPGVQELVSEALARPLEYAGHCFPGKVSIAHERGQRSRLGMGHVLTPIPQDHAGPAHHHAGLMSAKPDTKIRVTLPHPDDAHAGTVTRTSAPPSRGRSSPLGSRLRDADLS